MRTRVSLSVLCTLLITASASAQTVWYVDDDGDAENGCTSWEDACPELQTVLSLASDGDQVWIATGTYKPDYNVKTGQHTGGRQASFQLVSGVALYGGFDGTEESLEDRAELFDATILSGDLNGDDGPDFENNYENTFHVVSALTVEATIDGVVIEGGNTNGAPGINTAGLSVCVSILTVRNCTITDNWSAAKAGGIGLFCSATVTLENCAVVNNFATTWGGGIFVHSSSNLTMTDCIISANTASDGGGLYNGTSDATINDCMFLSNEATGSGGAMLLSYSASPVVTNCSFVGNSAGSGGALYNWDSDPVISNATFHGNTANSGYTITGLFGSQAMLMNCIIWDGGGTHQIEGIPPTIRYSDILGGYPGVGNIDAEPMFADADGPDNIPGTEDDNLRLMSGSPAIDAGDNSAVPMGITADLDGNPRFVDDPHSPDCPQPDGDCGAPPIVDMGAYEFQPPGPCECVNGRVTLCHIPPGNLANAHTITVGCAARDKHLAHGDHCGPCEDGDGLVSMPITSDMILDWIAEDGYSLSEAGWIRPQGPWIMLRCGFQVPCGAVAVPPLPRDRPHGWQSVPLLLVAPPTVP